MKIKDFTYRKDDIISSDGILEFCLSNNICYIKVDYFHLGLNDNYLNNNWRPGEHPKFLSDKVVIGHSDHEVNDDIANQFNKVFCTNKTTSNKNTYSLPLGLTNDCDDTNIHRVYGNKEVMLKVFNEGNQKDDLLYLNFHPDSHPTRAAIYDFFKNLPYVKVGNREGTFEGRENFLRDISCSKFTLSPRGNGVDTHRLWEALYMGSIPIVKYEITHDNVKDLPILFVDDFSEITESFLNEKYEEMINKEWNMDKLKLSYWEKEISNTFSTNPS